MYFAPVLTFIIMDTINPLYNLTIFSIVEKKGKTNLYPFFDKKLLFKCLGLVGRLVVGCWCFNVFVCGGWVNKYFAKCHKKTAVAVVE